MIGETISKYKILEKLGEGGMGVVYKAEDTRLKRPVAIKFFSPQALVTQQEKARFILEARAAAALDHPNICAVHEIDEVEGKAFIVMAHIDGYNLHETLEMGPLNVNDALDTAIQIAEGLQHAHEKGIVHRDIKPSNIMITSRGQAKITDFGLAKLLGHTSITETGTIMGTVEYMSPEQARGEPVDHRTDIWSLGVVLYMMLTGRKPFDAENKVAVIHKIICEEPDRIMNITDNLPSSVEAVVEKMMQKEPRDRYKNTGALLTDLRSIRSGISTHTKKRSPSIAVLPFTNMSADPDQEYFCDGLSEELINALTQIKDLKVVARTSAFSFRGKEVDVREIGKKLDVSYVLEGSVRKAGTNLRITAQLVNTQSGHHLWSDKYDRNMEDIFAIQDEITEAIVDKLRPKLIGEEKARLAKRQTVDLEAYNLYLKGRFFWNKRTQEGFQKARKYFQQVLEKDKNYARAYTGVADFYTVVALYNAYPPKEVFPKAKEAAMQALELDDSLAEAHGSMAIINALYDWDWNAAKKGFKRATELNPGYATAHQWYAFYYFFMDQLDEAIKEIKQALELDPLSLIINRDLGQMYFHGRMYDRAIEQFHKTLEIEPDFIGTHLMLGWTYMGMSEYGRAMVEFRKEKELSGIFEPNREAFIGIVHIRMGNETEARQVLVNLLKRSEQKYIPQSLIAMLYFALGDNDQGFEHLERAFDERDHKFLWYFKGPFGLDDIRRDPRFINLLKRMNLEP